AVAVEDLGDRRRHRRGEHARGACMEAQDRRPATLHPGVVGEVTDEHVTGRQRRTEVAGWHDSQGVRVGVAVRGDRGADRGIDEDRQTVTKWAGGFRVAAVQYAGYGQGDCNGGRSMEGSGLLTDRYELTMLSSWLADGSANRQSVFECFARRLPPGRRYGVLG